MSTARRCDSVILCTQGCMLKHSLGAFSSGKMTLGPNERDTSSITYCGRSLASSAPFRGGVVDSLSCPNRHTSPASAGNYFSDFFVSSFVSFSVSFLVSVSVSSSPASASSSAALFAAFISTASLFSK